VLLVEGEGIAAARALLESPPEACGLNPGFRRAVRMFYRAPNDAAFCYKERWGLWRELGCAVVPTTRSLQDAFDGDDEFAYDPETTGALVLSACAPPAAPAPPAPLLAVAAPLQAAGATCRPAARRAAPPLRPR